MDKTILGLILVYTSCTTNNIFLELIVLKDPGAGVLLTFLQFAFVAIANIHTYVDFKRLRFKETTIPLWYHAIITLIFCFLSVLNNKAFDFKITQPVHMVFRSSSLVVSFFLGFLFKKKYTKFQFLSVALVSIGIFLAMSAESKAMKQLSKIETGCTGAGCNNGLKTNEIVDEVPYIIWLQGVAILTIALILSSLLGHVQEYAFSRWGRKDPNEIMFFSHTFSLPLLFTGYKDLITHATLWSQDELFLSYQVMGYQIGITYLWVYVLLNVITQLYCLIGVYLLVSNSGILTCNLAITCRKFASLLFSIWYFQNPFTTSHWIGSVLVFSGVTLYALEPLIFPKQKTK